ncbi:MAG: SdpI family protein [Candidatus Portnoybacteria bacterium]
MKIFTKREILPLALILLVVLVSFYVYPILPEKVPSHWNAMGEIDDWQSRDFSVLFFPGVIIGIYILMLLIPLIDPLRKNYQKFILPYFWFRTILVSFLVLIYFYSLWAALGSELNINYLILPAISVLFFSMGFFMPKIKKNYFVGIRTPWTLASEPVWEKTHQFGGKCFMLAGIIFLLAAFFPDYFVQIMILIILVAALLPITYSYFIFKKVEGFKDNN